MSSIYGMDASYRNVEVEVEFLKIGEIDCLNEKFSGEFIFLKNSKEKIFNCNHVII